MTTQPLLQILTNRWMGKNNFPSEWIASEGLVYILKQSEEARTALRGILKCASNLLEFDGQSTQDDDSKPDIVGTRKGKKGNVLIIEAKFKAGLTSNQPLGYLKHLGPNGRLFFLCLEKRQEALYKELKGKLKERIQRYSKKNSMFRLTDGKRVHIITWETVIKLIMPALKDKVLRSNLLQIKGLCAAYKDIYAPTPDDKKLVQNIAKIINEKRLLRFPVSAWCSDKNRRYSARFNDDNFFVFFTFHKKATEDGMHGKGTHLWMWFNIGPQGKKQSDSLKRKIQRVAKKMDKSCWEGPAHNYWLPINEHNRNPEKIADEVVRLFKEVTKYYKEEE